MLRFFGDSANKTVFSGDRVVDPDDSDEQSDGFKFKKIVKSFIDKHGGYGQHYRLFNYYIDRAYSFNFYRDYNPRYIVVFDKMPKKMDTFGTVEHVYDFGPFAGVSCAFNKSMMETIKKHENVIIINLKKIN